MQDLQVHLERRPPLGFMSWPSKANYPCLYGHQSVQTFSYLFQLVWRQFQHDENTGLVRDLNPGPLAPKARIIPLDQRATMYISHTNVKIDHLTFTDMQLNLNNSMAFACMQSIDNTGAGTPEVVAADMS